MQPQSHLRTTGLVVIGLSLAVSLLAIVVDVGIWNTPYETADSAGHRMGFNDPLSAEHLAIIVSNFSLERFLSLGYAHAWLLLAVQGFGAWLVWDASRLGTRRARWFWALQGLLFPGGWLGFLVLPTMLAWLVKGTFDREAIIDVPFVAVTAQTVWITVSAVLFAASRRVAARLREFAPGTPAVGREG